MHAARNVAAYGEACDLCDMAAAYLFHIAENQPFFDGNKRAALASGLVFLHQNGVAVEDPEGTLYDIMIGVATKEIGDLPRRALQHVALRRREAYSRRSGEGDVVRDVGNRRRGSAVCGRLVATHGQAVDEVTASHAEGRMGSDGVGARRDASPACRLK